MDARLSWSLAVFRCSRAGNRKKERKILCYLTTLGRSFSWNWFDPDGGGNRSRMQIVPKWADRWWMPTIGIRPLTDRILECKRAAIGELAQSRNFFFTLLFLSFFFSFVFVLLGFWISILFGIIDTRAMEGCNRFIYRLSLYELMLACRKAIAFHLTFLNRCVDSRSSHHFSIMQIPLACYHPAGSYFYVFK